MRAIPFLTGALEDRMFIVALCFSTFTFAASPSETASAQSSIQLSRQVQTQTSTRALVERSISTSVPRCECGYTVNATNTSDSYALFTDLLETDFLHLYTLPDSISTPDSDAVGWAPQVYNVSATDARGPYGKSAELGNVILNPLPKPVNWSGEGKQGGAPGLQLWVRGQSEIVNNMVNISEIDSLRTDIEYGSFRIGMRMSDVSGTRAAAFWYRNNSQEIDMEYPSRQANGNNSSYPINLVIQTPASASAGYNAAGTSTFRTYGLPFVPGDGFHEYRFDWTPERVTFFADGARIVDFENGVDGVSPDGPGTLMLNHWTNGNPGWSGGPPAQDAVLTVSYVKAYFNTSNVTRQAQWANDCAGRWQDRTCEIPGFPSDGIDPQSGGEDAGKTFFFTLDEPGANVNQTVYPMANSTGGSHSGGEGLVVTPDIWRVIGWVVLSTGVWLM